MGRLQFLKVWKPGFFRFAQWGLSLLFLLGSWAAPSMARAESIRLLDGKTGEDLALASIVKNLKPGSVVLLGEQHGFKFHAEQQLQVIKMAQEMGRLASVGLEFFEYPFQPQVHDWRVGDLGEADFLSQIGWGSISFDFYRAQARAPRLGIEGLLALNAPRRLTSKVARAGLASLTPAEQALLPPRFERGNARYFERFKEAIGHLPDPTKAENYFMAQSIWDDTMAWRAADFLRLHPEQILFVVVGEFHVQYGGGLPDRLRARGVKDVVSFSLLNFEGLTIDEESAAIRPSALDGPRADVIWATRP